MRRILVLDLPTGTLPAARGAVQTREGSRRPTWDMRVSSIPFGLRKAVPTRLAGFQSSPRSLNRSLWPVTVPERVSFCLIAMGRWLRSRGRLGAAQNRCCRHSLLTSSGFPPGKRPKSRASNYLAGISHMASALLVLKSERKVDCSFWGPPRSWCLLRPSRRSGMLTLELDANNLATFRPLPPLCSERSATLRVSPPLG